MCGRFTLTQSSEAIATDFQADIPFAMEPRYNIAPTQPVLAIVWDGQSPQRQATHLSWGLIPSWTKDMNRSRPMINARAETVAEKPSFRAAFRRRRCLIPSDGFYEWQSGAKAGTKVKSSDVKAKTPKQPFYIQTSGRQSQSLDQSSKLFAFAGIWDHWQSSDGSDIYSCAILTMSANAVMKKIHHRMPVMLTADAYEQWLTVSNTDMQPFLDVSEAIALRLTPVNVVVNNPRVDHPDCVTPLV